MAATRMLQDTARDRRRAAPLPMYGSLLTTTINPERMVMTAASAITPCTAFPVSIDPSIYTAVARITQDTARDIMMPAAAPEPFIPWIRRKKSPMASRICLNASTPTIAPFTSMVDRIFTAAAIRSMVVPRVSIKGISIAVPFLYSVKPAR